MHESVHRVAQFLIGKSPTQIMFITLMCPLFIFYASVDILAVKPAEPWLSISVGVTRCVRFSADHGFSHLLCSLFVLSPWQTDFGLLRCSVWFISTSSSSMCYFLYLSLMPLRRQSIYEEPSLRNKEQQWSLYVNVKEAFSLSSVWPSLRFEAERCAKYSHQTAKSAETTCSQI